MSDAVWVKDDLKRRALIRQNSGGDRHLAPLPNFPLIHPVVFQEHVKRRAEYDDISDNTENRRYLAEKHNAQQGRINDSGIKENGNFTGWCKLISKCHAELTTVAHAPARRRRIHCCKLIGS